MGRLSLRLLLTALVLAAAGAGFRSLVATAEPWRGASWIWEDRAYEDGDSAAFYAVRDFELAEVPERAWLEVAADEAYIAYLNGARIGSGEYRPRVPIDLYPVEKDLRPGGNRLLIEARSHRGHGGLLASLRAGTVKVVTDREWRIYPHSDDGLWRGWGALEGGLEPRSWGRGKTGRWRLTKSSMARPLRPLGPGQEMRFALRLRAPQEGQPWHAILRPPRRLHPVGPAALFDWGEEITGYLTLPLDGASQDTALVVYGLEPPAIGKGRPNDLVIPVPGAEQWQASRPRRFRYVLLLGMRLRWAPEVLPLPPELQARLDPGERLEGGAFGLESWRPDSLAEERVWRRLSTPP